MAQDATHFVLGQHWRNHFIRKAAETGSPMTVAQLRQWIDDPKAMGLPKVVQNLVILIFAAQTNRAFHLHGALCDVSLTNLPDLCELREQKLPEQGQWELAAQRAGNIFGVAVSRLVTVSNVSILATEVKKKAAEALRACQTYCRRLQDRCRRMGVVAENTDRMKTALSTLVLLERVETATERDVVSVLATAEVATNEAAMGECLTKAAELAGNLETAAWDIFEGLGGMTGDRRDDAEQVLAEVRQALQSDEHVVPLAAALRGAQAKAVRLLTTKPAEVTPPLVTLPEPPPKPGRKIISKGAETNLSAPAASELLSRLEREIGSGQALRIDVSWVVEEDLES
jgi:hypothetical protein